MAVTADPNDRPVKKRRYSSSPEDPNAHEHAHVDAKRNRELIGPGVGMDLNLRHLGKTESFSPPPPPPQVVTAQPRVVLESQMYMGRERAQGRFGLGIEDGGFGVRIEGGGGVGNESSMEVVVPRPVTVSSRRSPPGSSAGRAKSARKSDPGDNHSHGAVGVAVKDGHAHEKEKEKKEEQHARKQKHVQHHPRLSGEMQNAVSSSGEHLAEKLQQQRHLHLNEHGSGGGSGLPKKTPTGHGHGHGHGHIHHQHQHPDDKSDQQDPHEWFLEHYDELAPGTVKKKHQLISVPPPPASPRQSPSPSTSKSPVRTKPRTPTPTPESAVAALEQELEEVVVSIESPTSIATSKEEEQKAGMDIDIDVDLAVAELVAETLEDNDTGHGRDRPMEVDDVEDELLSLVDDRPSARRLSSGPVIPASSSSSHHGSKPTQHESDAHHHVSPLTATATASTSASPASFLAATARASSSRPTPERGSMPPPVSTHVGPVQANKKGDRAVSVTATAGMKKKKEPGVKASIVFPYFKFLFCIYLLSLFYRPLRSPNPRQNREGSQVPSQSPRFPLKAQVLLLLPLAKSRSRHLSLPLYLLSRKPVRRPRLPGRDLPPSCPVDRWVPRQRAKTRKTKRTRRIAKMINSIVSARRDMTRIKS